MLSISYVVSRSPDTSTTRSWFEMRLCCNSTDERKQLAKQDQNKIKKEHDIKNAREKDGETIKDMTYWMSS